MTADLPLYHLAKPVPALLPGDSISRAIQLFRITNAPALPVIDASGKLMGQVKLGSLSRLTPHDKAALLNPIQDWLEEVDWTLPASMGATEAYHRLRDEGATYGITIADNGAYLGIAYLAELAGGPQMEHRPPRAGGMATPWGIYLSCGVAEAGVGSGALFCTGILLGVIMFASYELLGVLAMSSARIGLSQIATLWSAPEPTAISFHALAWYGLHGLAAPMALLALRLAPMSGHHAAEHQVVHAMERDEPLELETTRRMPRVHPRCGTNLVAGAAIFVSAERLSYLLGLESMDGVVVAMLCTWYGWRRLGSWLQQHLTTRPATDAQLEKAIATAQSLVERYSQHPQFNRKLGKRLWSMGMPQTAAGVTVGLTGIRLLMEAIGMLR